MVKITKKEVFKLNKGLKMHLLINDIAAAFNQSYFDGIMISKDINNKSFPKLRPSTIEYKKKKGYKYPSKPLFAKGKMRNTYVKPKATPTKRFALININKREREEASIRHNEGIESRYKNWFGVGTVQKAQAQKISSLHIKKALR